VHDISKAAGEWYVRYYTRQYGLTHTILRYADVYGAFEGMEEWESTESTTYPHPLNYFMALLSQYRRPVIRGTGEEVRDAIFIDDVVQANLCALKRGDNQTLHISSGYGYTLNQLYQVVADFMESDLTPIYLSGSRAETQAVVLDNRLARRVLGWRIKTTLLINTHLNFASCRA
jgi:UDP-glucose 4-epimerase